MSFTERVSRPVSPPPTFVLLTTTTVTDSFLPFCHVATSKIFPREFDAVQVGRWPSAGGAEHEKNKCKHCVLPTSSMEKCHRGAQSGGVKHKSFFASLVRDQIGPSTGGSLLWLDDDGNFLGAAR